MMNKIKSFFKRNKQGLFFTILGRDGKPLSNSYSQIIEVDENRDLALTTTNESKLKNTTVSNALRMLVKSNVTLSAVLDIHQTFSIRDYSLVSEGEGTDTTSKDQIQQYIDREFSGIRSFRGFLKQLSYYRLVEGGIALRITYDPETLEPHINAIAPTDLAYTYVEEENENDDTEVKEKKKYLLVGKKIKGKNNKIEVYYDERESDAFNMNFIYVPATIYGDKVFGNSLLTTAIKPVYNRQKLIDELSLYTNKKIFPNVIYSGDLRDVYAQGNISLADMKKYAQQGAESIKKAESERDNTQDSVSPFPIEVTELSGLAKTRLDGLEVIFSSYYTDIINSARVPSLLLKGKAVRTSLNDNESEQELYAFTIRNEDAAKDISEAVTRALFPVSLAIGVMQKVGLDVQYDDTMRRKMEADLSKSTMEFFGLAIDKGVFSAEQAFDRLAANSLDFSDMKFQGDKNTDTSENQPTDQPTDQPENSEQGDN